MKRKLNRSIAALAGAALFAGLLMGAAPGGAPGAPGAPGGGRGAGGGFGGGGAGGAGALGGGARGGGALGGGARGGGRGAAVPPGPPAPVPPEVAMARPTPDELAKINETVNRMVQSDPLLQKYSSLISVATPRPNPCIAPTPRNAQRHAGFVETANKGDVDLLFEGDSITDWWVMNGPNAFKKYFGDIKVGNFAIAGDTTQGVLWGLQNGEAKGPDVKIKPKAIMLMIGTNNTGGNTAAEIAEGVGAIVLENRKDFPDAKILLLAVFPRGLPNDANRPKIADINKIISKLDDHQHVFYMDIGAKFLDPETKAFLPDSFRTDNLHPQEKGYDIWGAAVMPTLSAWLK